MDIVEEKLNHCIEDLLPHYSGEPILVAVSGGLDSMVCAYILKKYKYPITIAHCNFQLREKDSDLDALLVKNWAKKNKIPYLEKKFNVKKKKGESVQMVARELRYHWFNELMESKNFSYLVTAHHLNDHIETSLMNIIRGTGIQGITGIPAINGKTVRPMLNLSKEELEVYANRHKIIWREDKSNAGTKYKRNKIRHELIPLLTQYNPNFIEVYGNNLQHWKNAAQVYKQAIVRLRSELVHFDETFLGFKISVLELMARRIDDEILFELISEFGFNSDQAKQIAEAIHSQPGKRFYSNDHALLIDRLFIFIKPIDEIETETESFSIPNQLPFENEGWEINTLPVKRVQTLKSSSTEILLNDEKIDWPITIRKWKAGDKFTPMGMKGQKKISDFLTDAKVDLFHKEDVWVVVTAKNNIAGIIGFRPDEKFKISKNTKLCLYIKRKKA